MTANVLYQVQFLKLAVTVIYIIKVMAIFNVIGVNISM